MLLTFIIGLIFIVIGYLENYKKCPPPKIEYRYVPRSFYEEQVSSINLRKHYSNIFDEPSTWSTYPFNDKLGAYNTKNYGNFVEKPTE